SYQTGEPVIKELVFYTPPTVFIAVLTIIVVFVVALPLGIVAAKYYNTWLDNWIRILTSFTVSIPSFFLGIIFIYVFDQKLDVLLSSGLDSMPGYILHVLALIIDTSAYHVRL